MEIKEAYLLTKKEQADYFDALSRSHGNKVYFSQKAVRENEMLFADLYLKIDNEIFEQKHGHRKKQQDDLRNFDKKICSVCGAKMNHIAAYNFWGCPNYKDVKNGIKHSTFSDRRNLHVYEIAADVKSWLTRIITASGFKGVVRSTELLDFYNRNGFVDLKIKYEDKSSQGQIDTYKDVKKNTGAYEYECFSKLKPKYDKVIRQLGIKYKLIDDVKFKYCFLDLVASNKTTVNIFECKTWDSYCDDVQKELYIATLTYIKKAKGDNRTLLFNYLIQNYTMEIHSINHI